MTPCLHTHVVMFCFVVVVFYRTQFCEKHLCVVLAVQISTTEILCGNLFPSGGFNLQTHKERRCCLYHLWLSFLLECQVFIHKSIETVPLMGWIRKKKSLDQPKEGLPRRWFPVSAQWCSRQPWQGHKLLRRCRSPWQQQSTTDNLRMKSGIPPHKNVSIQRFHVQNNNK